MINYGMSIQSIGDDLFGSDASISDDEKTKKAQKIFDAVMKGFPALHSAIEGAQANAKKLGYTETILGRRRHHPDMQLPKFEFVAEEGYINPDVNPLDVSTLNNKDEIPERIQQALQREFASYKYNGQIYKRIRQLHEQEHIKVINNTKRIEDARRQVWNSIIQGSSAELTKMAMLRLESDSEWQEIGGRLILPVHDELIVEVPFEHREKGAEILKRSMEQAGGFLPFPISCDIEMTFRWYGLEVDDILSYDRPESMDFNNMSESNVKWVQSRLFEQGYVMPVMKNPDGSKPIGVAAKGINGVVTDELKEACKDYMNKYSLTSDEQFLNHIDSLVTTGIASLS